MNSMVRNIYIESLLAKATPSDVCLEPFPHILVQDPLPEDHYSQLVAGYPSISTLQKGSENKYRGLSSNRRFHYLAKDTLGDDTISSLWKDFIRAHVSESFLKQVLALFHDAIAQRYPGFEQTYGRFEDLKSGIRRFDSFETADVLLDALICVNSPVTAQPTSVRRAHVDLPDKLFTGLFYMRDPEDDSAGGDLELYRFKQGKPGGFRNYEIPDKYIEWVKTIPYDRNVLILFLNSVDSLHGVTVRSHTSFPRYFVNLVGEIRGSLFDIAEYQEPAYVRYLDPNEMKKAVRSLGFKAPARMMSS